MADHILDAPGGIDYNARMVAWFWETTWLQLEGRNAEVKQVLAVFPDQATVEVPSNIFLYVYFARPVLMDSVNASTVALKDSSGRKIEVQPWTNLRRPEPVKARLYAMLKPLEPLKAGETYTATLLAGVKEADSKPLASEYSWTFTIK